MKLKLDVINKLQEPTEEVKTIKFCVLPDGMGNVDILVTLPDGTEDIVGYFTIMDGKISLSLLADLPQEYFNLDSARDYIYTF